MALKQGRLGSVPDAIQYDDGDYSTSIEVDDPVRVNAAPVVGGDVLRLGDLPSDPTKLVYSDANVADNTVVRGDGGTRKVQESSVTISDSGSISIPAGQTVDGRDPSADGAKLDTALQADGSINITANWDIDGADTLFVDKTNSRIGVGTASPNKQLHIIGVDGAVASYPSAMGARTQLVIENDGNSNVALVAGATDGAALAFYKSGGSTREGGISFNYSTVTLQLGTDVNINDLILDSSGNLGIGLIPTANMSGLSIEAGVITIKERTTPTADAGYGKIYTKSDNKLYFQDGAGTEHEIAFV